MRSHRFEAVLLAASLSLALVTLASGCILPNVPPPISSAKLVHPPGAQPAGKISLSTGWAVVGAEDSNDDLESAFYFFPVEGGLMLQLHPMYDAAVSLHNALQLQYEGNLNLLYGQPLRVGIVHGLGLGLYGDLDGYEGDWEGSLTYSFTIGLLGQFDLAGLGTAFLGCKYSYSGYEALGDNRGAEDDEPWTHYVTTSLGLMLRLGNLLITPEFVFAYGALDHDDLDEAIDTWIIMPAVSVAAGF